MIALLMCGVDNRPISGVASPSRIVAPLTPLETHNKCRKHTFDIITKTKGGHIVGPGGSTIKAIQEYTGAKLEVRQGGPKVKITSETDKQVAMAAAVVKRIVTSKENPDHERVPLGASLRKEANAFGDKRGKLFDETTVKRNAGAHVVRERDRVSEGKKTN